MRSRVLRRLFTCALLVLFTCLAPKLAHATATITIYQEQSLPRVDEGGRQIAKRPINLTPEGVNNQDCVNNVRIRFPLQLANFEGNGTLEAWAGLSGESCSSNVSRTSQNTRVCWKLVSGIPLTINQNVDIPVRTIMSGIRSATAPDDSPAVCGTVDLTTVSINFLYFSPGQTNEASTTKTVSVQVDTVGPSAPSGLRALPGNTRLIMNWDNISGEAGVSVLTGIRVYCDANHASGIPNVPKCQALIKEREAAANSSTPNTDAGTTDAGVDPVEAGTVAAVLEDGGCIDEVDDAGNLTFDCADAGTSNTGGALVDGESVGTGGSCESANLAPPTGRFAPTAAFNECFSCGSITGNTGTSVVAGSLRDEPLVNGTTYAIAVAATDALDNVGPLSAIRCEYPEETNDFWQAYKNAGGNAGGGCNTTGGAPIGTIAVLGTTMAVVLSSLRRKRKK